MGSDEWSANGNTTTYGYDAAGRMTSTTDALGKTVVYAYNDLGQKIRQENRSDPPLTASITWTYDGAGRVLTRTANNVTTTYTYDASGNKLSASDGTLTITATYDRLNRPLTVDDEDAGTTADTTYTYSLTSPSWTDPTGTYLVTLDKLDRPTSVDGPAVGPITTSYRSDGQLLSRAEPNGNTTAYAYDALGRELSRTTTAAGPVTRAALARTYNRAGQVLTENSTITGDPTNGLTTYTYDPLERLTGVTSPAATTTTYGWDEVPNRTSVTTGGGGAVTTTYDAANRPQDQAGVANAYTSDADGRLTTQPSATGAGFQRYEWDSLGRLTTVKPPSGGSTIATYTYDPLDRLRLADYGANTRTRFRYVGLTTAVAQLIDDKTGAVSRNIGTGWGGERQLDWTGTNANIRYYGTNAHHDTVWTASSTGAVSATLRYDPWGTLTTSSGSSLPDFRFQGSWFDDTTKLSWVITRWYAPALGRFLSEDSLLGTPADPPSRHLYAYAAGEPIGRWDPDGREPTSYMTWRYVRQQLFDQTNVLRTFWLGVFGLGCLSIGAVLGAGLGAIVTGAVCSATGAFVDYQYGEVKVHALEANRRYRSSNLRTPTGEPAYAVKITRRYAAKITTVDERYGTEKIEYRYASTYWFYREWRFASYTHWAGCSTTDRWWPNRFGDWALDCSVTRSWKQWSIGGGYKYGSEWPKFGDVTRCYDYVKGAYS